MEQGDEQIDEFLFFSFVSDTFFFLCHGGDLAFMVNRGVRGTKHKEIVSKIGNSVQLSIKLARRSSGWFSAERILRSHETGLRENALNYY